MPTSPPAACPCGGKRKNGVCDRCGPRRRQHHAQTTKQRGYGHDWRRLRQYVLASRPLCEDCDAKGIVTAASEVHHVRKIKDSPDRRLDPDNLLALCGTCHDRRTARGE